MTNKQPCCEKCELTSYERDEYDRGIGLTTECHNPSCECHTPASKQTEGKEYITAYDLRGPWADEPAKESIREQINTKIDSLLSSERKALAEKIEGMIGNHRCSYGTEGKQVCADCVRVEGWNDALSEVLALLK